MAAFEDAATPGLMANGGSSLEATSLVTEKDSLAEREQLTKLQQESIERDIAASQVRV